MLRLVQEEILRRAWNVVLYLLACLGLLVLLVTFTPFVQWAGAKLAGPWRDPQGEVLIVLAGSMLGDGVIGDSSYLRSEYAITAYRNGSFRSVVVSGGGRRIPEAALMARFMECQGVPQSVVSVEDRSTSTQENALYTKSLLQGLGGRKVLLTSDYHMFRAYRVFRKAGIDVAPRPIPDVLKRGSRWKGRWPAFLDLITEACKIFYYYMRGWI